MEPPTADEDRQTSITHASDSKTKMDLPVLISNKDKLDYTMRPSIGDAQNPQDLRRETRLLERAEYILQHCGLTEGSPELEKAKDQVQRRLRRQSKLRKMHA